MGDFRGACAIIERNDGKVLLHLRDRFAWIYPNCWAFFGGGVNAGESAFAGLRRELIEEIGYLPYGQTLLSVAWHHKGGKRIRDYTFLVRWHTHRLLVREGQRADWFSIEEALVLPSLPPHERHDLTLLQTLRRKHGRTPLSA